MKTGLPFQESQLTNKETISHQLPPTAHDLKRSPGSGMDAFNLPTSFCFCPRDDDLIVDYLRNKNRGLRPPLDIIKEYEVYKCNPEQLPRDFKYGKQNEMYCFTTRDRKYPHGSRPNRSAGDGYWRATNADQAISAGKEIVGYKSRLVFYKGKYPGGKKTDWVMREYRTNKKDSPTTSVGDVKNLKARMKLKTFSPNELCFVLQMDGFVLCRVYELRRGSKNTTPVLNEENGPPGMPNVGEHATANLSYPPAKAVVKPPKDSFTCTPVTVNAMPPAATNHATTQTTSPSKENNDSSISEQDVSGSGEDERRKRPQGAPPSSMHPEKRGRSSNDQAALEALQRWTNQTFPHSTKSPYSYAACLEELQRLEGLDEIDSVQAVEVLKDHQNAIAFMTLKGMLRLNWLRLRCRGRETCLEDKIFSSMEMKMEMLLFPPGVRFMPTDIELVKEYLMNKILNRPLPCDIIQEVDLSLFNPDQLACNYPSPPGVEGVMYFFTRWKPRCNSRSSRQAGDGFWKATVGSAAVMEKETGMILGYKRGLKFHKGIPEKAEKTTWLMDEYKIDKADHPAAAAATTSSHSNSANPWFLCRIHMNQRTKKSSANSTGGLKKIKSQQLEIFQDPPQPMSIYDQSNYFSNGHRAYPHHYPDQPMHDHEHHHQISDFFDGPIDQTPSYGGNSTDHELMTAAPASTSDQSSGYGQLITTTSTHDQSCNYDQNDGVVQMLLNCYDDDLKTLEESNFCCNDQYHGQYRPDEGPDRPIHDDGQCGISDYYDGPLDQTCTSGGLSTDHELMTAASAWASASAPASTSDQSSGYGQLITTTSTHDQSCNYDQNDGVVQMLLNCYDDDLKTLEESNFCCNDQYHGQYRPDEGPDRPIHDDGQCGISDYYDGPLDQTCTSGGLSTDHELMTAASAWASASAPASTSDQSSGYGQLITTTSTHDQSCNYDQNDGVVQMLLNCYDDDLKTLEESNFCCNDQYHGQYCPDEGPDRPIHDDGQCLISDYYDGPIDQTCTSGGLSTDHELMTAAPASISDRSSGYGQLITTTSTHDQSSNYDQNDGVVQMLLNCLDDDLTTVEESNLYLSDQYLLRQCPDEGPDRPIHDDGHCMISDYYDGPIDQTCTSGGLSSHHELTTASSAAASSDQSLGYGQLTTFTSTHEPCYDDDVQTLLNCWDYALQ
ncbi:hypothetical protein ACLOJK_009810 [Asimina triloba]